MNCADIEILICDYVDGTLAPAERAEVERHLGECPACAELARDAAAAVSFMERAAEVEPPPELVTRILFDAPWSKGKSKSKPRIWLGAILSPILQPKYAMGMAMTILSLSMLARFVAPVRQPKLTDLQPSKVWAGLEDRAVRAWARTLKFYDNLKVVYQIQTTLREWQQQDEEQRTDRQVSEGKKDDRKLPVKRPPNEAPPLQAERRQPIRRENNTEGYVMNCQNHPEVTATAYCRSCGKALCEACRRDAFGTVYCAEHAPEPAAAPAGPTGPWAPPPPPPPPAGGPYMPPPPGGRFMPDVSPGLAFFLGWIPGVGAIYNGQYAKGLVHAVVFGILVSIVSSSASHGLEPVFGIMITVWMFYMAFEAYHTARKRRMGEPVDEYSSLIDLNKSRGHVPVSGIALIVLGVLLLLHTLDLLDFEYVARYWPVLLIAAGGYLLYNRVTAHGPAQEEVRHERQ